MDDSIAIRVEHVSKEFKVYLDKGVNLKERVLFKNRRRYEERKVLRDISFDVKKGEAIGLVGQNGCGKSTMLKLLSRIMYPDSGSVEVNGRVSALIELGAGFHPDMSGRENIYTNAAIFGLTKKEIDARIDDIIAFSELEAFIDNPVRTYSSGMYMRLAFAVAINVDADILLIDEILAVGDAAFQAKCFNRMMEIKAKGTTIVIVSHALSQIEQICDRTIWIQNGRIRMEGAPRDVHPHYMAWMAQKNAGQQGTQKPAEDTKRWGSGEARMEKITVLDGQGRERNSFSPEEAFTVRVDYAANSLLPNAVVGLAIYRSDQTYIYGTNTLIDTSEPVKLQKQGTVLLHIDRLPVANGHYTIDLALHRPDGFDYDFWRECASVSIAGAVQTPGVIHLEHHWKID